MEESEKHSIMSLDKEVVNLDVESELVEGKFLSEILTGKE